jgi:hypothetical protein
MSDLLTCPCPCKRPVTQQDVDRDKTNDVACPCASDCAEKVKQSEISWSTCTTAGCCVRRAYFKSDSKHPHRLSVKAKAGIDFMANHRRRHHQKGMCPALRFGACSSLADVFVGIEKTAAETPAPTTASPAADAKGTAGLFACSFVTCPLTLALLYC